jgi:hypothetical protein
MGKPRPRGDHQDGVLTFDVTRATYLPGIMRDSPEEEPQSAGSARWLSGGPHRSGGTEGAVPSGYAIFHLSFPGVGLDWCGWF